MADINPQSRLEVLEQKYPDYQSDIVAVVDIRSQELRLFQQGLIVNSYSISTAKKGVGNQQNSFQTPLGVHYIREKFGHDAAALSIFKSRKYTGQIAQIESQPRHTGEDLVTSRILWLSGLEPGVNSGKGIDSYRRYIYIHGTHEEGLIGQLASHGCIRMKNDDVIELFQNMPERSLVLIVEE